MKLGLTALRWIVGLLFFGHGTQKLFGWFDGNGLEATAQGFEKMGLRPGRRHATAAGAAEAGGGGLLALGLLTPAAAATLIGVMTTAVRKVHFKNGPWVTQGGYEYNLVLVAILLALADLGPGDISLDHALGTELRGPLVALGALAGGVAGSTIMLQIATDASEDAPTPSEEPPAAPAPSGSEPVPAAAS